MPLFKLTAEITVVFMSDNLANANNDAFLALEAHISEDFREESVRDLEVSEISDVSEIPSSWKAETPLWAGDDPRTCADHVTRFEGLTVGDLLTKLRDLPQDTPLFISSDKRGYHPLKFAEPGTSEKQEKDYKVYFSDDDDEEAQHTCLVLESGV